MTNQPSTLAEGFASLRRAAEAQPAQGWMPSSVHALIMACLVRIFARLEDIIRAWQDGTLTPPPVRAPAAPHNAPLPHIAPARPWFDLSAWSWPWSLPEGQGSYVHAAQHPNSVRPAPARPRIRHARGAAPTCATTSSTATSGAATIRARRPLRIRRPGPAEHGPRACPRARQNPPRISIARHPARAPPLLTHPRA